MWIIDGNKYYFKKSYLNKIDSRIKALSEKGVLVNIIIANGIKLFHLSDPEI